MVEADEMMDEDASKMAILESSFRQVASTTRLSDKAIACIQISLNNGGQFSSVFELQEVMTEIIATLSTIEYRSWLFSQEGRDYMCESARFDQFLHDQLAMGFFHQFLVQEYSSENLEFIESVLMFESDWASLDIESPQYPLSSNIARARQIVKLYVEDNAPLQINVPSKIRVRLERKVIKDGEPAKDMFRAAKGEISNLIQKDSWPRFKKSLWWSSYMNFDLQQLSSSAFDVMRSKRHEMYLQFIGDDNLSTILCSDIGQEYLRAFLTIMASKVDGSIDFLLSVQRLKEEKGKFDKVRQIFDWYFSEMAPFPVLHVSPDVAANIQGCITCNPIAVSDLQNFYATAASQTEAYLNEKALPLFKLNGLYAKYRVLSQQRVRVEDTKPVVAAKNISKVY
ncbi:hypothetical protein LEN26_017699 [Aphanomyces euteiches]|nr:hypothetical protein LEN26_017699 [Aphanomyces euteiches]